MNELGGADHSENSASSSALLFPGAPPAKHKIVLLGDSAVGKTSILQRFLRDSCPRTHEDTIGTDLSTKNMHIGERPVQLKVWDTAGNERFRGLIGSYLRDCCVAVIVYDISNRESFLHTKQWLQDVRAERGMDAIIFLVGNKTDVGFYDRQVTMDEVAEQARRNKLVPLEVSAKAGYNIRMLFQGIARALPAEGDLGMSFSSFGPG